MRLCQVIKKILTDHLNHISHKIEAKSYLLNTYLLKKNVSHQCAGWYAHNSNNLAKTWTLWALLDRCEVAVTNENWESWRRWNDFGFCESNVSYSGCRLHHNMLSDRSRQWCYDHDDVIKWKHSPPYWLLVWGIHRSPMNSSRKGQWRGALIFSVWSAPE